MDFDQKSGDCDLGRTKLWYLMELKLKIQKRQCNTLIEFAKFEVETVLVAKTCNFDSNISDWNSVDLKKIQNIIRGQVFFQRPNLNAKGQKFPNFMIFSLI